MFRKDRSTRGGGVCLLVSKFLCARANLVSIPTSYNDLKILAVDFSCSGTKTRIILTYRRPGFTASISNDLLFQALETLILPHQRCIILGDFNLPELGGRHSLFPVAPSIVISVIL